jgi:hypothetical protein
VRVLARPIDEKKRGWQESHPLAGPKRLRRPLRYPPFPRGYGPISETLPRVSELATPCVSPVRGNLSIGWDRGAKPSARLARLVPGAATSSSPHRNGASRLTLRRIIRNGPTSFTPRSVGSCATKVERTTKTARVPASPRGGSSRAGVLDAEHALHGGGLALPGGLLEVPIDPDRDVEAGVPEVAL